MKSRSRRVVRAVLLAALLAAAPAAHATVVAYLPLAEHIQLSTLVVRVNVGESRAFILETDGLPRTETRLSVIESYKGDAVPGQILTVRQMRGVVQGETMQVAGDPEFREGEQLVLFLDRAPDGTTYLTALSQSVYKVEPNLNGNPVVIRDLDGLGFYFGGIVPRVSHGADEAPVPLELFGTTVREISKEVQQ